MPRTLRAEWTTTIHLPEQRPREEKRSAAAELPDDIPFSDNTVVEYAALFTSERAVMVYPPVIDAPPTPGVTPPKPKPIGVQLTADDDGEMPLPELIADADMLALGRLGTIVLDMTAGYDRAAHGAVTFSITAAPYKPRFTGLDLGTGSGAGFVECEVLETEEDGTVIVLGAGDDDEWATVWLPTREALRLATWLADEHARSIGVDVGVNEHGGFIGPNGEMGHVASVTPLHAVPDAVDIDMTGKTPAQVMAELINQAPQPPLRFLGEDTAPKDILTIHAEDGEVIARLSAHQPSFVNEDRLGEAAGRFWDAVISFAAAAGVPVRDANGDPILPPTDA